METNESTRVMGAGGAPAIDRTMVAGAPAMPPPAGATQMGVTVVCPVCRTSNSGMEAYCGECGFLLSSAPGQEEAAQEAEAGPSLELVENSSGRRFRLKPGVNVVGRENCDILLIDGTVSRRHAQVSVENGGVTVTDLGSTNGTKINGSPIAPSQPASLTSGSTVQFGNTALTFSGATEPTAPADVTIAVDTSPGVLDQTLVAATASPIPAEEPPAAVDGPLVSDIDGATDPDAAAGILRPVTAGVEAISVRPGSHTIGRRAGNDIVVSTDPYISGAHALLHSDASGTYITDVGSTNGTTVNGERLAPNTRQLLLDGDEVTLGQTSYRFESAQETEMETGASTSEDESFSADSRTANSDEVTG